MKKTPQELLAHLESLTFTSEKISDSSSKIIWSNGSSFVFSDKKPDGFEYNTVDESNNFMQLANQARFTSGCFKQQTGAIITLNNQTISTGSNIGELKTWCEREKLGCKTGEGYEHCKTICKQFHHAERTAIHNALSAGIDLQGASLYLSGHWWMCIPCWKWIIDSGITSVFLDSKAVEKFTKPESLF